MIVMFLWSVTCHFSCGGSSQSGPGGAADSLAVGPVGWVKVLVADTSVPLNELSIVQSYRVRIEGADFSTIEKEFPVGAGDVVMDGIPRGKNRTITVTATNKRGDLVRQAVATPVTIEGGKTVPVEMTLEGVPLLLNLSDGKSVFQGRLLFQVLVNEEAPVEIRDEFLDAATPEENVLPDLATGATEKWPAENGVAQLYPGSLKVGKHHFTIENTQNHQVTTVDLLVLDGTGRRGATFFSGGGLQEEGGLILPSRVGQTFARPTTAGEYHGELWANILEALWK